MSAVCRSVTGRPYHFARVALVRREQHGGLNPQALRVQVAPRAPKFRWKDELRESPFFRLSRNDSVETEDNKGNEAEGTRPRLCFLRLLL